MSGIARAVEAAWRIEGPQVVATLARVCGDLGLAEDAAQEALAEALQSWERTGVPRNPGAWLTTVARRRAIDHIRRSERRSAEYARIAHELEHDLAHGPPVDAVSADDDLLGLVFTACHPVLARESQVALTLRVVSGLSTEEIARLLLVPVPTVQQRIVRAKRTLGAAHVPFGVPPPDEWSARLDAVLAVIYLVFTEGYAATSGDAWMRPDLAIEATRLGRRLAGLMPTEPEVHGLVALMELQSSRFGARTGPDGGPVVLENQDRRRWDRGQITRGLAALARADAQARGRGPYALQAAIAACHATAPDVERTDWAEIVVLYEALGRLTRNPVVALSHAVAVSMADGPEAGLALVDALGGEPALSRGHLLPSVRGELLARLGRRAEAVAELRRAAELTPNLRQQETLKTRADRLASD